MTELALHYSPFTCAKVPLLCLEEIGVPFTLETPRLMRGEHKSPAFRRLNPSGKVPVLVVDGRPLSETVAIVSLLNALHPDKGVLPPAPDAFTAASQLADLCVFAADLHPFVRSICVPMMVAPPEAQASVQRHAAVAVREVLQIVEDRLAQGPWWYGEAWSALDAYAYWAFTRLGSVGYDFGDFPRYAEHAKRMAARPATRRVAAHDAAIMAQLEAEGVAPRVEPMRV